jgi:hypothetical protein
MEEATSKHKRIHKDNFNIGLAKIGREVGLDSMTSAYGLMYGCFEHSNKTSLRKLIS